MVDDGSTDGTPEAAARSGARVVLAPAHVGKGSALEGALDRMAPADVYLLIDGDVGSTASEATAVLAPVLSGSLELCVGRLPRLGGGGFGTVKRVARWFIRAGSGFDATEPLSGQRATRGFVLEACRPVARGFGLETGMTMDAARLGFRVGEVDLRMTHRATGRGIPGFLHRGRQGWEVLRAALPRLAGLR